MERRRFLSSLSAAWPAACATAALHGLAPAAVAAIDPDSRQATGLKVGEVSSTGAIVWMRVTAAATRQADGELRRGAVQLVSRGGLTDVVRAPGWFGEMGALTGEPRTQTATVVEDAALLVVELVRIVRERLDRKPGAGAQVPAPA